MWSKTWGECPGRIKTFIGPNNWKDYGVPLYDNSINISLLWMKWHTCLKHLYFLMACHPNYSLGKSFRDDNNFSCSPLMSADFSSYSSIFNSLWGPFCGPWLSCSDCISIHYKSGIGKERRRETFDQCLILGWWMWEFKTFNWGWSLIQAKALWKRKCKTNNV